VPVLVQMLEVQTLARDTFLQDSNTFVINRIESIKIKAEILIKDILTYARGTIYLEKWSDWKFVSLVVIGDDN